MKYHISFRGDPLWVRMYKLDNGISDMLIQFNDFNPIWDETEEETPEYDIEKELITCDDAIEIKVFDENYNDIFMTESLDEIQQYPCDENEIEVVPEGYEFKGVEEGTYLIKKVNVKSSWWEGVLEIDEEFDPSRLYLIQDDTFNDEFRDEVCFPMGILYYRKTDSINPDSDIISTQFISDKGGQSSSITMASVTERDWWCEVQ